MKVVALILLLVSLSVSPLLADWEKGLEARQAGDAKTAFLEWSKSAQEGHAASQYNLALLYLEGVEHSGDVVVEKNVGEAIRLMSLAAAQGDLDAAYYLGIFYLSGFELEQDLDQAYCWFERTARSGYARGYFALGKMNFEGMGRKKDLVRAHAFLAIGQTMGHKPSGAMMDKVVAEMTSPLQVEQSIAFINEFGALDTPLPECRFPEVSAAGGS